MFNSKALKRFIVIISIAVVYTFACVLGFYVGGYYHGDEKLLSITLIVFISLLIPFIAPLLKPIIKLYRNKHYGKSLAKLQKRNARIKGTKKVSLTKYYFFYIGNISYRVISYLALMTSVVFAMVPTNPVYLIIVSTIFVFYAYLDFANMDYSKTPIILPKKEDDISFLLYNLTMLGEKDLFYPLVASLNETELVAFNMAYNKAIEGQKTLLRITKFDRLYEMTSDSKVSFLYGFIDRDYYLELKKRAYELAYYKMHIEMTKDKNEELKNFYLKREAIKAILVFNPLPKMLVTNPNFPNNSKDYLKEQLQRAYVSHQIFIKRYITDIHELNLEIQFHPSDSYLIESVDISFEGLNDPHFDNSVARDYSKEREYYDKHVLPLSIYNRENYEDEKIHEIDRLIDNGYYEMALSISDCREEFKVHSVIATYRDIATLYTTFDIPTAFKLLSDYERVGRYYSTHDLVSMMMLLGVDDKDEEIFEAIVNNHKLYLEEKKLSEVNLSKRYHKVSKTSGVYYALEGQYDYGELERKPVFYFGFRVGRNLECLHVYVLVYKKTKMLQNYIQELGYMLTKKDTLVHIEVYETEKYSRLYLQLLYKRLKRLQSIPECGRK